MEIGKTSPCSHKDSLFVEPTLRAMMTGGTTDRTDTAEDNTPAHGLRVSAPVLQFPSPIAPRETD
jgi:hypothetical protein